MNYTERLQRLQDLLGPAVLIPVERGGKKPIPTAWQTCTMEVYGDPEYQAHFADDPNIAASLGAPSGGLCTVDVDRDEQIPEFLQANPRLNETLASKGSRGCNFWLRVEGDYPATATITHRTLTDDKGNLFKLGEWRATGSCTVISGLHPAGHRYTRLNHHQPITLRFEELRWPPDWRSSCIPATPEEILEAEHGQPYIVSKTGNVKLNQSFFAAKFAEERRTLWDPAEHQFYQYRAASGLWRPETKDAIKQQLSCDLRDFATQVRLPAILAQRSNRWLVDVSELLRGVLEQRDAWQRRRGVVHVRNGVVDLAKAPPALVEFHPTFYSRNQCPYPLDEDAGCERFTDQLLRSALDDDDISLLQRFCGACLLGHNAAQKLLVLVGTAGGGKSTVAECIESIVGADNCAELRTDLLYERFEVARFIGKTLLTGKDVPGSFLQNKGASGLKKLVGHDLLSAEKKGSNEVINLRGDFNVLLTCNSRLLVQLDGDTDAWRRRLLIIEYERPRPPRPIRDFGEQLLAQEGAGILQWMLRGAVDHLAELQDHGDYLLSERQRQRIDNLLDESDSVTHFVRDRVVLDASADVTTEELIGGFQDYCEDRGWQLPAQRDIANRLPQAMLQTHRTVKRNDILREGKSHRGYKGVRLP